jgi:regulator of sigma E protease
VVRDKDNRWRVFPGNAVPKPEALGGPRTIYSLNALPIGGFVRPRGEDDPTATDGLAAASKTARIVILAAGSTFNLVFAFVVITLAFRVNSTAVAVASVAPDTPAARAGLQPGDIIKQAGETEVNYTADLQDHVRAHLGEPIVFTIIRQGKELHLTITPRTLAETPQGQGPLGIALNREMPIGPGYSWPDAIARAGAEIYYQVRAVILLPGRLLQGQIAPEVVRPVGPVGIYQVTEAVVDASQQLNTWFPLVQFIGAISVALGLTNLLPLPALDGGRILFVLIEAIRGKRVDPAREGLVHLIGMVMLLTFMVIITYQDIVNPILPR